MKAKLLLLIILLPCFAQAQQDSIRWKRSIQTGLNLNQASFSDNWKGGGGNSIALGTFLNAMASFKDNNKISFDNDLQLVYGFMHNKGQSARKTNDRIFLDSKLGYKIGPKWDLFASLNFSSQFDAGFEYKKDSAGIEYSVLISNFMAPGYLTSSLGLEYKPVDYFWLRFGIGTLRQTFVLDTNLYKTVPKNYGVEIGKKMRNELAFQFIASFDRDIAKNMNLKTRFSALSPYENLGRIVSRLDATLTAKVNKYINVNLTGTVLNDPDMDSQVQYSQGFALGILFNF